MSARGEGKQIRILGIDPSTRLIGWGLIDATNPGKPKRIDSGVIEAIGGTRFGRFRSIRFKMRELMKYHAPHILAVESGVVYMGEKQNIDTALAQAEARGIIIGVAIDEGMEVVPYTPTQVKKAATGKGNSKKSIVARMVTVFFGMAYAKDDEADALAVALAHANHLQEERLKLLPVDPMAGTFWANRKHAGEGN